MTTTLQSESAEPEGTEARGRTLTNYGTEFRDATRANPSGAAATIRHAGLPSSPTQFLFHIETDRKEALALLDGTSHLSAL